MYHLDNRRIVTNKIELSGMKLWGMLAGTWSIDSETQVPTWTERLYRVYDAQGFP